MRARHRAVYLVYHDNRLFAESQRLFKYKAGLRHTALERINKQENAVHHLKYALDLASEIGVSRSVHNVYPYSVIHYACIL